MIDRGLFLLIPLFVPVLFSRMTQDSFLFPKEIFFAAVTGAAFFYRLFILYSEKNKHTFSFNSIDGLLLALLLTGAISIAGRSDFYPALHPFVIVIASAVFYYELKLFNKFNSVFFIFTDCFIVSGLAGVIYAFIQYYRLDFLFGYAAPADKMRLFSFFGNKNYFSEFLTAVIFIIIGKILILSAAGAGRGLVQNIRARLAFYYISLAAYFTMIFIIQSRASFVALAAGGIYLLFTIYGNARLRPVLFSARRGFALAAAALILAAAVFSSATPITVDRTDIFGRLSSIFGAADERNIAIRLDIWHATAKMIRDNFWFGCGLGYFKMNYLSYQGLLFKENSNLFYEDQFFAKANQAHNELLQIFCELGVFGFLFAASLVMVLAYVSRRITRPGGAASRVKLFAAVSISASLISVFINSLFGFPLHILPSALVFLTCVAVIDKLSRGPGTGLRGGFFSAEYTFDPRRPNVIAVLISAAAVFIMLFSLAPSYLKANIDMKAGLDLLKLDRHGRAEFYLKRSIAANPFNGEARYYMGICLMQKKEYDGAVMEFLRSLQSESDPNIYSNIGLAFYKIGMYDHAVQYMNKALELSPHNVYYLLNAGCAYQKKEDFRTAVDYFQRALSFAGTPEALINLGHAYYLMGIFDKAETTLADALARYGGKPHYAERIYYLTGLAQTDSKKYESAAENFRRARALDVRNPDYALNLGLSLIFAHKTAEAELIFGEFLKGGFNELIAYNLGGLYYNEKRFSDALVVLNEARGAIEKKLSGGALENDRLYRQTVTLINDARGQKSQNNK